MNRLAAFYQTTNKAFFSGAKSTTFVKNNFDPREL
jgi:hypothetical protein